MLMYSLYIYIYIKDTFKTVSITARFIDLFISNYNQNSKFLK